VEASDFIVVLIGPGVLPRHGLARMTIPPDAEYGGHMTPRASGLLVAMALGVAACGSDSEQPAASGADSTAVSTTRPDESEKTPASTVLETDSEQPTTSSPASTTATTTRPDDLEQAPPSTELDEEPAWKPSVDPIYEVVVTPDVVYGQGEVNGGGTSADLLLDLYVPDVDGQDTFPLVVTIHGGGFNGGSKDATTFVSEQFAQRGYIVASIDYRVTGDAPVPTSRVEPIYDDLGRPDASTIPNAVVAAMDDTMTALDFLHVRPDVEPSQTVLWGNSAGAITAMFVGYGMDDFDIERPPVAAVISNSGGFVGQRTATDFIEENRGVIDDPPYSYSEGPVFMTHATGDTVVAYQLSQDIVDRAEAIGHPYEMFSVEAGSHGLPDGLFKTEFSPGVSVFQAQVNWLDGFLVGGAHT
jgi:alpha-beta hydrolase superfamily lysophospholipase